MQPDSIVCKKLRYSESPQNRFKQLVSLREFKYFRYRTLYIVKKLKYYVNINVTFVYSFINSKLRFLDELISNGFNSILHYIKRIQCN